MTDPAQLTATAALAAMQAGHLSASALAEACLARVAVREPVVQAFAHLDPATVMAQAEAADGRRRHGEGGPLLGIPVGFKDIIETGDQPTAYGSPIYAGHQPAIDASVVAYTRHAGGIVFGKMVTTEFANVTPGPTTNPHDPARTPGGSSSGSAAAVAAGMIPFALGTQTSGSVIRPGAYCGVHTLKGSWGDISYAGVKQTSASLDTIGCYARSLADLALIRAVLTGTAPMRLESRTIGSPRIGLCRTAFWHEADTETQSMIESAATRLAAAGGIVGDPGWPKAFDGLADAHRWISSWEGARSLARERFAAFDQISPQLRDGRIADGTACSPERYKAAWVAGERARLAADEWFDAWDVLITPAAPGEAPYGTQATGSPAFNSIWTLLHVPCVSLPGYKASSGMPLGLQLIGRRGTDHRLLEVASWIERVLFG